jgi:hypothetical protein
MNRLALTAIVCALALSGCSSSSSSDTSQGGMADMASALDQHNAATSPAATAASATAAASTAPTAAVSASAPAAAPAAADPSLRTKRGFDLKDWSNEAVYVLVKADAATTAAALATAWNAKVVKDVLGKPSADNQVIVYQLAGHPWSVFACDGSQIEPLSTALSSNADVLFVWNSDFNGWSGVDLYRAGKEVEAVHWGAEGDGLGEDRDASKWHTQGKVGQNIEGETYSEVYLFRSTARKVTEADLAKGEAFVDAFLRHHDAYLLDMEQMPWADLEESNTVTSPLPAATFAAVHAVEVPER